MTESLFDILSRKDFSEPPEIALIKDYIGTHLKADSEVVVHEREIIITVASAALAGTLRFHVRKLQEAAKTKKRLILRIR